MKSTDAGVVLIYIAGRFPRFQPQTFQETYRRATSSRRLGNVRSVALGPYVPNHADVFYQHAWSFSFARSGGDTQHRQIRRLLSLGGHFDACSFSEITEIFTVPAEGAFTPRLYRRPFQDFMPAGDLAAFTASVPNVADDFATTDAGTSGGVPFAGEPVVAATADAFGQVAITPSSVPDPGTEYSVHYVPLLLMRVDEDGDAERTVTEPNAAPLSGRFVEC